MCANYESQLQAVQENEKKAQAQLHTLGRYLDAERTAMEKREKYCEQLENTLKTSSEDAERQVRKKWPTLVSFDLHFQVLIFFKL